MQPPPSDPTTSAAPAFWLVDPAGALAAALADPAWRLLLEPPAAGGLAGAMLDEGTLPQSLELARGLLPFGPILLLGSAEADGCTTLAKPVRLGEALAWLRRAAEAYAARIPLGAHVLDPAARTLMSAAGPVRLTEKEVAILALLHANPAGVGREQLLADVFGYAETANTHTVETHIWRLRQKLEGALGDPLILTDAGFYKLTVSVGAAPSS